MKNMPGSSIWCFLIWFCLLSCSNSKTTTEFKKWVEDESNGLNKKKNIGEYKLEIQYKPVSYVVARELGGKIDKKEFDLRLGEIGNTEYYDLLLSVEGGTDIISYNTESKDQHYYNKQYYLSFGFQDDIWLEIDNVKIPCSLYHFERTYDLSNKRKVVLAFNVPKEKMTKDKVLVINGEKLGFGVVRTIFKGKDIEAIPELIIDSL